jgi:hypothetical protein
MSTLKSDAVTAVTADTALSLSGAGTAGVKISDYLVQTKGADVASNTTLTLGKDGNLFDVTGTTTITGIATQGIGSYVTLHFDGVLTFTHHSTNLILPGAANITTAAGDIAVMYEYASADWRCVSYTKASGLPVVAAGGGWTLLGNVTASASATVDFIDGTGGVVIDATYDRYVLEYTELIPASDDQEIYLRWGNGSFLTSNYAYDAKDTAGQTWASTAASAVLMCDSNSNKAAGTGTYENASGVIWMSRPGASLYAMIKFDTTWQCADATLQNHWGAATNLGSPGAMDRCQILMASGNVASGEFRLYGLKPT